MVVQTAFSQNPPHIFPKPCPRGSELFVAVPVEKLPGLCTPGGCHHCTPGGLLLGAPSLLHLDTLDRLLHGPTLLSMCRRAASFLTNSHFSSCLCLGSHSRPIWSFSSCPNWGYCFYSKTLVCVSHSGCSCPSPSCKRPRSTLCVLHMAASRLSVPPC